MYLILSTLFVHNLKWNLLVIYFIHLTQLSFRLTNVVCFIATGSNYMSHFTLQMLVGDERPTVGGVRANTSHHLRKCCTIT